MLQETAQALGVDPLFVERDWVLTEIIFHPAQHPEHRLVLKGGQALRHIYGNGGREGASTLSTRQST
jgi:predicted nucleotidyltransferase component of viral defense system